MQPSRAKASQSLVKFTEALLDHRANDAKVSKDVVQSAFEQWKGSMQEVEGDENYLQSIYEERHHHPRMEAKAAYQIHLQQQQLKRRTYLESHMRDDLHAWLSSSFEAMHHAAFVDPIFTKYVHGV